MSTSLVISLSQCRCVLSHRYILLSSFYLVQLLSFAAVSPPIRPPWAPGYNLVQLVWERQIIRLHQIVLFMYFKASFSCLFAYPGTTVLQHQTKCAVNVCAHFIAKSGDIFLSKVKSDKSSFFFFLCGLETSETLSVCFPRIQAGVAPPRVFLGLVLNACLAESYSLWWQHWSAYSQ